ncbi:MAG: hypothetical protein AB1646_01090 [Thermodesulfobacteriota bacterium]
MTETLSQCSPTGPDLPVAPKRKRWRSVLFGVIILLGGMVIGSGSTLIVLHKLVISAIHHPEQVPKRIAKRISRKLDLSKEQAAKVQAILIERQKALLAIRREVYPRVEAELRQARDQVAAILEPEKAQSWRNRFEELRAQWMPPPPPEEK